MHTFHHKIREFFFIDSMNGDNVRVTDCGGCLGFPQKSLAGIRVGCKKWGHHFDRNNAIQLCIARPKNDPHPPLTDHFENVVFAQRAE